MSAICSHEQRTAWTAQGTIDTGGARRDEQIRSRRIPEAVKQCLVRTEARSTAAIEMPDPWSRENRNNRLLYGPPPEEENRWKLLSRGFSSLAGG